MTANQQTTTNGPFDHIDLDALKAAIAVCRNGWQDQSNETVTNAAASLYNYLAGAGAE